MTEPPEMRSPCGSTGLTMLPAGFGRHVVYVADCLASRAKPWLLVIWEPLHTKAPSPARCAPFYCYINTVVFYHRPYIVRPFKEFWTDGYGRRRACKGGFEQYDQVETRLRWHDVVTFEGESFTVFGGQVVWARKRWWMRRTAHRAIRVGERAA